jgi:hypothetical protein
MYQIGPSIHIPLLVTIWGLVTCLQGLVTRWVLRLASFLRPLNFSYFALTWYLVWRTATMDFSSPGESKIYYTVTWVSAPREVHKFMPVLCFHVAIRFFLDSFWALSKVSFNRSDCRIQSFDGLVVLQQEGFIQLPCSICQPSTKGLFQVSFLNSFLFHKPWQGLICQE